MPDPGRQQDPTRGLSRRDLLRRVGLGAVATPSLLALLDACARQQAGSNPLPAATGSGTGSGTASNGGLQLASPDNPVTWPIATDNAPIAAGLAPEKNATLQLYNYADYIDPAALKSFEKKYKAYNVKVSVSTFNDTNEALTKIRTGAAPYDIYFPSYDQTGKMILGGLLRSLQHSYIPNISNVWTEFQNPFYDGEWRYTVPYTIYTTGVGWRTDQVSENIGARPNPWDVLWDAKYKGKVSVLDDYREGIALALLKNGGTDLNTGDTTELSSAKDALLSMAKTTAPKVTVTDYSDLPEGRLSIVHAWSGDMVNAISYLPKGKPPSILRYWFPASGKGPVNNDLMVILKTGKNPVLAHLFINHMLEYDVAIGNFGAIGYQPPQVKITPEKLVADGFLPANLASATVLPKDFGTGYRELELSPTVDAQWQTIWQQFKAGG